MIHRNTLWPVYCVWFSHMFELQQPTQCDSTAVNPTHTVCGMSWFSDLEDGFMNEINTERPSPLRWSMCSRNRNLTWKAWLAKPRPSCLHTTMASMVPQLSLHTAPHTREPFLSARTSTRPSYGLRPPLNRSWGQRQTHVSWGAMQIKPAFIWWDG